MINASTFTDKEKCQYLFQCLLSKGFEHDCPCNHQNCTQMMMDVCPKSERFMIIYPPEGLINPTFVIFYNYSHFIENLNPPPQLILIGGSVKCRGYLFQPKLNVHFPFPVSVVLPDSFRVNHLLCTSHNPDEGYKNSSSPFKHDKFCWNNSLTFNGRPYAVNPNICIKSGECISQYRIRDGSNDCYDTQNEKMILDKNYCTGNVGLHRFQCFNDERKCLPLHELSTGIPGCSNSYDESWYGNGIDLRHQLSCFEAVKTDCYLWKAYIQQSSTRNLSINSSLVNSQQQKPKDRMPFRHYCDSFWNLDKHVDEIASSCQYWICQNDQYQCQTGQCIKLDWVCDGEWDCSDASDEEAFVLVDKPSIHNARLSNLSSYIERCRK